MTQSNEITEHSELPERRPRLRQLLAVLLAALLAAVAAVSFSTGSAGAQSDDTNGGTEQQQSDEDSDEDCDHDGTHRGGNHGRFGSADVLTEVLGTDAETLRTKLMEGSSLADIAAEQGVEVSDVVDALVTAVTERAAEHDREVDADELTARITAMVNGERPDHSDHDGKRGLRGRWHRSGAMSG